MAPPKLSEREPELSIKNLSRLREEICIVCILGLSDAEENVLVLGVLILLLLFTENELKKYPGLQGLE